MSTAVAAGGGFLLAVLWMDLMFDVQVLSHRGAGGVLPEEILASMAAYYRRVTTTARPMSHLIAAVMVLTVAGVLMQIARGREPTWVGVVSLALSLTPTALALLRVVPDAIRLGRRCDSPAQQSVLARAICRHHLFCFAAIAGLVGVQIGVAVCEA